MRVYLTTGELKKAEGHHLLSICRAITEDGRLDLDEIKLLRRWLRANQNAELAAVPYLTETLDRIAADRVIDADELKELHLAIERVIPPAYRQQAVDARLGCETARKEMLKERERHSREVEKERKRQEQDADRAKANRIRHAFAKVAGVSFPNDNGSDRQRYIKQCKMGERLLLEPDENNPYSDVAVKIVRENGNQIGHAPEYLAERINENVAAGKRVAGFVASVTGGSSVKPTRGVNFVVLFAAPDVSNAELSGYVDRLLLDLPDH